jgi:hypothetical protein
MSRQYKLIKKYPSLADDWEVGMIVGQGDRGSCGNYSPCHGKYSDRHISSYEVHNHPEFWEEVIEKDFEILSFTHKKTGKETIVRDSTFEDGGFLFDVDKDVFYSDKDGCNWILKNYNIHSVKRLSDSEVFTVGGEAKSRSKYSYPHIIESIEIGQKTVVRNVKDGIDRIWVNWADGCGGNWLENIEHCKPLFRSEDNVDIFEGDKIHSVDKNLLISEDDNRYISKSFKPNLEYKYFSTRENAEEYILLNKPCLSIMDIKDVTGLISMTEYRLKELVKSKL